MPALFAVTLFSSALLLFLVQPMVGKMVLPHVGGSPAVWNTCMVFFQALLLFGYWYAHKLTSLPSQRRQVVVHLGVLGFAAAVMATAYLLSDDGSAVPVLKSLAPRGSVFPFFWVILMMTVAIGVPFFAVSTSAPLLQRWFTATGHPSSRDPYFLYAASNAGSLISLLAYPVLVEPHLKLVGQTWLFGAGFLVLVAATFLCGRASLDPVRPPAKPGAPQAARATEEPSRGRKWKWMLRAFVPSSLMLGITTKMTTDVASVPMLWIIPLTLYLITFIIAFAKMPSWFRVVLANVAPVVALLLVFVETSDVKLSQFGHAALHVTNFFLLSLLMHGELAHDRPDPKHLTGYFLWISFGGVAGGLFNSLLAPLLFPHLYEYPLAIVVGCLLIPGIGNLSASPKKEKSAEEPEKPDEWAVLQTVLDFLIPVGLLAAAGWLVWANGLKTFVNVCTAIAEAMTYVLSLLGSSGVVGVETVRKFAVFAPPCMLCFLFIDRPLRFGLCVLAVLFVHHYREADRPGVQRTIRSFFGIMRIDDTWENYDLKYMPQPRHLKKDADGKETLDLPQVAVTAELRIRSLSHGTTLHGKQFAEDFHLPMLRDEFRALSATSGWESLVLVGGPMAWDATKDPLTYYHRTGPIGDIFREAFRRKPLPVVGMVGLGTGSVAAYAAPGQSMTFYEIDKAVKDMIEAGDELSPALLRQQSDTRDKLLQEAERRGRDGKALSDVNARKLAASEQLLSEPVVGTLRKGGKIDAVLAVIDKSGTALTPDARKAVAGASRSFTFVTDARKRGADVRIVLGDARLTLEEHDGPKFDLLLIDAFSSDSIPTHLLTVESVKMYRELLADNGLLAMHVSNRYLRLEPVVRAIADALGMSCRLFADDNDTAPGKTASSWIVLARNDKELGEAFLNPPPPAGTRVPDGEAPPLTWRPILHHPEIPAWTDDFMDVLRVSRFEELQTVRRWFGLPNPVPNYEEKTRMLDHQMRKPIALRLYGLDTATPDMAAVSEALEKVVQRKRELRQAELVKPLADRRFGLNDPAAKESEVSDELDKEAERLDELEAAKSRPR